MRHPRCAGDRHGREYGRSGAPPLDGRPQEPKGSVLPPFIPQVVPTPPSSPARDLNRRTSIGLGPSSDDRTRRGGGSVGTSPLLPSSRPKTVPNGDSVRVSVLARSTTILDYKEQLLRDSFYKTFMSCRSKKSTKSSAPNHKTSDAPRVRVQNLPTISISLCLKVSSIGRSFYDEESFFWYLPVSSSVYWVRCSGPVD